MKYLSGYLLLLSVAFFNWGCSDNYGTVSAYGYPLSVSSVSLSGVQSRSTNPLAVEGATISVSTLNSGAVSGTSQYTCAGGVWGTTTGSSGLIAPEGSALCAYYPYSADITDKSSIPLSSVKYDASKDISYAYSTAIADAVHDISYATFNLQHAYARLTFNFSCGSSYTGSKSIGNIRISNSGVLSGGNLNITQSTGVYNSKVAGNVTFNAGIADFTSTPSTSVLMVPTDALSGDLSLVIQIGSDYKVLILPTSLFTNNRLEAGVNYQIAVNVNGTLTLGSTAVQSIDWIADTPTNNTIYCNVQPESNSYMITQNGTILIPVSRATAGNATKFPAGASFTADLLWSDVSATHVTVSVVDRYIKVIASSAEGNSVVCARNSNGDIVWSWHIWVTRYDPSTTNMTYNGKVWMDRNLGAKTGGSSSTAYGLYYQWGRKDPFPGAPNHYMAWASGTVWPSVFGGCLPTSGSGPVSLGTAIENPYVFYEIDPSTNPECDWLTPQSSVLWANSGKTIYDPCPYGWHVPLKAEFNGAFPSACNTTSGFWTNGVCFFCETDDNAKGCWWSGSIDGVNVSYLDNKGNVSSNCRSWGYSVRCVKD